MAGESHYQEMEETPKATTKPKTAAQKKAAAKARAKAKAKAAAAKKAKAAAKAKKAAALKVKLSSHMRIEYYLDTFGEWRWRLLAKNAEIIADGGEGYKTKAGVIRAIDSLLTKLHVELMAKFTAAQKRTLSSGAKFMGTLLIILNPVVLPPPVPPVGSPEPLDELPPTVTLTVPANGSVGVLLPAKVNITFSEAMDPETITVNSFTLRKGELSVSGEVTYLENTATFTPHSALEPKTTFTATITSSASDLAGNRLAMDYVFSFTTKSL
jgi:uncharacterized protein YegP (UPF0339 family)